MLWVREIHVYTDKTLYVHGDRVLVDGVVLPMPPGHFFCVKTFN